MQKRILAALLLSFVVIAMSTGSANAQMRVSTAVPFLLIAPDARASGMGDVGAGLADNATALYWNPAGLAFQTGKQVNLTHSYWLPQFNSDLFYDYLAFKWGDEEKFGGTIGAAITYLNLGEFLYTLENSPDPVGKFTSFEYAIALAYATKLSPDWGFGGTLRYIQSSLSSGIKVGQEQKSGVARSVSFDISALWKPDSTYIEGIGDALTVGFNLANIGPRVQYVDVTQADPLPTLLRVGASYKLYKDDFNDLTFAADISKLLVKRDTNNTVHSLPKAFITSWDENTGRSLMFASGIEYWYDNVVALRSGYYVEGERVGGREYMTFGAGLKYDVYDFDFSYIYTFETNHPLANTLRFSLGINW